MFPILSILHERRAKNAAVKGENGKLTQNVAVAASTTISR